jgi:hypothetical protein
MWMVGIDVRKLAGYKRWMRGSWLRIRDGCEEAG